MTSAGERRCATAMGALAVLLAACNGDGGTETSRPTTVVAASTTTQTAVAGTAVAEAPAVRVTDQRGEAMAGVAVTFVVTGGGGTLASTAATTSASGVATAGTWTLGPAAGQNTVTATVGNLTPVQFIATAQARTPTTITALSPTTQTGSINTSVFPEVRVDDQLGAPMAGVVVTFAVTGGGGSVRIPDMMTDASGRASAMWTLGPAPGVNMMTVTVAGLAPVTFTATAYDPCAQAPAYTPLSIVSGSLRFGDCRLESGHYTDFYSMALPAARGISLRMSSAVFDTWLEVYDAGGDILAVNDDREQGITDSEIHLFAPAGSYLLGASSYESGVSGAYELFSGALEENTGCGLYWLVPSLTLSGRILSIDCTSNGYYFEAYAVVVRPGRQLTLRMESTAFDPVLALYDGFTGAPIGQDDDGGGGTSAQLVYTSSQLTVVVVVAATFDAAATGAYTLTATSPAAGRTTDLRSGRTPAGLLDVVNAAARERGGGRKGSPAARTSILRVRDFAAPGPRAKPSAPPR